MLKKRWQDIYKSWDYHEVINESKVKGDFLPYQELYLARDIQRKLGYQKWSNFKKLIEKAIQLIENGVESGVIERCRREVSIESGAKRTIIDYKVNIEAVKLINQLAYNKLNKGSEKRNETIMMSLLEKYCLKKKIDKEKEKIALEYGFSIERFNI